MALITLTLLLCIGIQGCALTSNRNDFPSGSDALTANGDVCQDCTKIFELVADLMSNADFQKKVMNGIEVLCAHLPGPASKTCKDEVEKMFPVAITFITGFVKPAQVCKVLGLCGSCENQERMLRYLVKELLQAAETKENVQPTTQCSFCLLLIKTLEELLPKERTESAVTKLLEEICHILPSTYRQQCENVIEKFGKTVLDEILSYATPQNICTLIHMCHGQDAAEDPCTSTMYRCKDIKTAAKCGTLFYCQRFVWKPANYNTI